MIYKRQSIESLLQFHTQVLPLGHPKRIKYEHYLGGDGSLTLHTFPQGAHARLLRYDEENRRLIASPYQYLGKTPIIERRLPMGSYIVGSKPEDIKAVDNIPFTLAG